MNRVNAAPQDNEKLVTEKALSNSAELLDRKETWADAHRHTPHGRPVELGSSASWSQARG